MFKVIASKSGEKHTHWYDTAEKADNAAFALRAHPMFKYKTYVEQVPIAYIGYDTESTK